ncbi:MAG TPA: DUF4190 domain-containing protein [Bacteroidia bacterium]|nr:DUF4190 domain-containing protein [Bacteroidia bacterium]
MNTAASSAGRVPVEWSKPALAGMVFGLLGLATVWLGVGLAFAAVAAVSGHLARHETSGRPVRGRRFATAALVLGYGTMLVFPVLVGIASLTLPAVGKWKADSHVKDLALARSHASRLYVACEDYARANRGRYPEDWEQLSGGFLPEDELHALLRSVHPGGRSVAFELVAHDRPVLEAISDSVIVIQEIAPSSVPDITVLYANGRASTLRNPDYEEP